MKIFEIEEKDINKAMLRDFIRGNCQPWLQETNRGQYKVYRGLGYPGDHSVPAPGNTEDTLLYAFIKPIETNRKPRGLLHYRDIYNVILGKMGVAAQRYNSVSVTSNKAEADKFDILNNSRVFIPVGEFHYTWSTVLVDWGEFKKTPKGKELYQEFTKDRLPIEYDELPEIMEDFLVPTIRHDRFGTGDLIEAIESGNEIAVKASYGLYIEENIYKGLFSQ